jgi:maltose/maltodextrin transport system permease protein
MKRSLLYVAMAALGAVALAAGLAVVILLYAARQHALAAAVLALLAGTVVVYTSSRTYVWRYLVPGIVAVLFFILVPMLYTGLIGFTNYSSRNLLTFERATAVLLARTRGTGDGMDFKLYRAGAGHRFEFTDDDDHRFVSEPVTLGGEVRVPLRAAAGAASEEEEPISLRDVIALQPALRQVVATLPDGTELRLSSITRFIAARPAYTRNPDGTLTDKADGAILRADHATGFWRRPDGAAVSPGFRTYVAGLNYQRIFTQRRFFEPFARVFTWSVAFATFNTLFTFGIGIVFAALLSWEALRFRNAYRMMLFLPYAVPAFLSIPIFRGLFNENLGEINLILDGLFGIRPSWFSEPMLARSMVLLVNTWLGYPYMMILCMGLIRAIPNELYEASAVEGAGPLDNFFRITLPLVLRPIMPLLIASFATNFNNLTLIELLTRGLPDFLDTEVPAGSTDLLASYTYRIAFRDSGQNYALACAISSIIFVIVAALAVINLRLFKVDRERP